MAIAGVVFAFSESYAVLVVAAFAGTISPSTNDNTPFSGVEQAILAQTGRSRDHTRIFTAYNVSALSAGAVGGLVAAALGQLPGVPPGDAAFAIYALLAVATIGICLRLSPDVEASAAVSHDRRPSPRPRPTSCGAGAGAGAALQDGQAQRADGGPGPLPGRVRWLAGLFALDAFAGGLAVQTMLAWWLQHQYGATATQLGMLSFAANLLSAVSQLAAPALAGRHGLLATMLVPHAISNVLLLCVPLAPNLGIAAVLLLTRHAFSKIDVPARQAFTAAIVRPAHRTAAASVTSVARSVAVCASPMACSVLLTGRLAGIGAPLLLAGGLAISYDTALWRSFRKRPSGVPEAPAMRTKELEDAGELR
jgi:hypothetical protein